MPLTPDRLRLPFSVGKAALTSITLGERVPYLGMAAQRIRIGRGRTLAVVGVTAFVLSVWLRIAVVSAHPESMWLTIDLGVYYDAGKSLAHSQSTLYSGGFGLAHLPYLYPPLTALAFYKISWVDFGTIQVWTAGVSIGCLVVVAWAAWGLLGYRASFGRVGASFAVAAVGVWLEPVHSTLNLGQVNMLVMALAVADLAQSDRKWTKGVGIGLATAIKLTPGLFIVYLLVTRRVRAALVAAGTFLAVSGATWVVLPKASREFWFHAIGVTSFDRDYAANQSLQGMFLRFLNNSESTAKLPTLLACVVVVVIGMTAAALASNRGAELLAVCVIGIVALEISPISWSCHWVWFEPVVVLAIHSAIRSRHRWATTWAAVGTILTLAWPMRVDDAGGSVPQQPLIPTGLLYYAPHLKNREEHWDPFQMILGNSYVLGGIAFIVAVLVLELRTVTQDDRPGPAPAADAPRTPDRDAESATVA